MERLQLGVRFEFKAPGEGILGLIRVSSGYVTYRVFYIVLVFDVCHLDIIIEALLKYMDNIADLITCLRVFCALKIKSDAPLT